MSSPLASGSPPATPVPPGAQSPDPGADGRRRARLRTGRLAAAVLVLAVAVVALAVAVGADDDGSAVPGATQAGAVQTVRDFVTAAAVLHDGTAACRYLTGPEQGLVARVAGPGAACREAFDAAGAGAVLAVRDGRDVAAMPARAVLRDGRAEVILGTGARAQRFVLRPTTAAEQEAFGAPAGAWRIAEGAGAVLAR